MSDPNSALSPVGGCLAVQFANAPSLPASPFHDLSWEEFVLFLQSSRIVTPERGAKLLSLSQSDPQSAHGILSRATRLRDALREAFAALVRREKLSREWTDPINEVLRITEGHDELVYEAGAWKLEFVAREHGLDWLLAAIARSAAEILVEGPTARLRICANPACGLLFCDTSRTHRRRWCSMAVCGNRHKVASFARRHAS